VYVAPFDVRLPDGDQSEKEIATVVQPDLTVICDPAKLNDNHEYGRPRIYAGDHQIQVGLFPDLVIDLKKIFRD
jgi:hypothetical protein